MKTLKPETTEILTRVFSNAANQYCLSIGLIQSFALHPSAAQPTPGTSLIWPTAVEALGEQAILDEGLPKTNGEFLVYGAAYPPIGHTAQPISVNVTLGSLQKKLAVFGDRSFNALGLRSAPEAFQRMPITPAQAFGGPSDARNPAGKGIDLSPSARTSLPQQSMPNVEAPNRLMVSPTDKPEPAGFWALTAAAPQRTELLGRFDNNWLKHRWPHLPTDTQDAYYQTAPSDQRLTGFFRGDERVSIQNMHGQFSSLDASLPGLRARVFVAQRVKPDETVFKELSAPLETVWLLPDQLTGLVLYRAVVALSEIDAADIQHLYAELEPLNAAPQSLEQHYQKFLILSGAELAPDEALDSDPPVEDEPAAQTKAPEAQAKAIQPPSAPPPTPDPDPDLERELRELKALGQDADNEMSKLKQSGFDFNALEKKMALPETGMSAAETKKLIDESSAQLLNFFKNSGKSDTELIALLKSRPDTAAEGDLLANTPGGIQGLIDEVKKSAEKLFALEDSQLKAEQEQPPTPAEQAAPEGDVAGEDGNAGAGLLHDRQWVIDQHARGESFVDQDLSHLDLSGLDLCDADFTGAQLAEVNFAQARLERTRFDHALLSTAILTGANLSAASLKGVSAGNSDFNNCNLSRANLRGGDFSEGHFEQANFDYSDLKSAIFSGSSMNGLSAKGAVAENASFEACSLIDANFTDARLKAVSFNDSVMTGANLTDALCQRTDFSGANLSKAKLSGAGLQDSEANAKTSFAQAVMFRANLTGANWAGPCLDEVNFDEAVMNKADLT
ncbi:MAG: DUF2169 domain-containing protein, partial [Candidatus Methylopumilus sp.]|nr:DUF2169 domain-containing protein [Candidatus Methylopumilus sp.]